MDFFADFIENGSSPGNTENRRPKGVLCSSKAFPHLKVPSLQKSFF
jgi:hypothetical protein